MMVYVTELVFSQIVGFICCCRRSQELQQVSFGVVQYSRRLLNDPGLADATDNASGSSTREESVDARVTRALTEDAAAALPTDSRGPPRVAELTARASSVRMWGCTKIQGS